MDHVSDTCTLMDQRNYFLENPRIPLEGKAVEEWFTHVDTATAITSNVITFYFKLNMSNLLPPETELTNFINHLPYHLNDEKKFNELVPQIKCALSTPSGISISFLSPISPASPPFISLADLVWKEEEEWQMMSVPSLPRSSIHFCRIEKRRPSPSFSTCSPAAQVGR